MWYNNHQNSRTFLYMFKKLVSKKWCGNKETRVAMGELGQEYSHAYDAHIT